MLYVSNRHLRLIDAVDSRKAMDRVVDENGSNPKSPKLKPKVSSLILNLLLTSFDVMMHCEREYRFKTKQNGEGDGMQASNLLCLLLH